MLPADVEWLALAYLTPVLSPTPCATRLPVVANTADTINGFLRIESAGGGRPNIGEFDLSVILHAYSPNEVEAVDISRHAMAYMCSGRGQTVSGWYISGVTNVVGAQRLTDPEVNLVRYRSAVTWRVAGQVLPGS